MVNTTYFNTIAPYEFNSTGLAQSSEVSNTMISNAISVSDGLWYFSFLLVLCAFLIAVTVDPIGIIRLDFLQSLMFATGISTILAAFGFILGFTNDYSDLTFFGAIFLIATISKYINKLRQG